MAPNPLRFVVTLFFLLSTVEAFVVKTSVVTKLDGAHNSSHGWKALDRTVSLRMADSEEDRLRALGYSEEEIGRSRKLPDQEPPKVRVDMVDDVDAVSLTTIGFGLIALNFLVFANMGDGGIAGVVATFINTWNN